MLFIIAMMLLYSKIVRADDIQILHEGTKHLYFKITDVTNKTLEVINREDSETKYIGDIIIPEIVYLLYQWEAIPYKVTSIGENAFLGCSNLTSVEIPNSVTNIGDCAFYNCDGITSVEIPNSVTSIGNYAFYDCDGLTDATIGNSVTSIGNYAFLSCTSLTNITIGNSVTSLGNDAFEYCSKLRTVINLSNLTFSKGSTDYGYIARYANKVINAPNGFIDSDYIWFENESGMTLAGYLGNATELVLPKNYKGKSYDIGDNAFYGYTGLTNVTIPDNVTSIGDFSFWGCNNLTNITSFIPAGKLFAIREYTFCHVDWKNCTLYVPYNAKEKYASTDGWKYFKNIVELRDTYKVMFCIDGKEIATYDIKEGDSIIYPTEYGKEGYSLIWDTNIDIMPSCDITIDGTFCVNTYTVTFMIDGEIYGTATVEYGVEFKLPTVPEKEDYTFSGWNEASVTMPAEDIIITGSFIHTSIKSVSVDATVDVNSNSITIIGANNSSVAVYTAAGALVKKIDSYAGEEIMLDKGVYIIRVGGKAVKVKL